MDQNGNDTSPKIDSNLLQYFADLRRARDKAEEERRQKGPTKPIYNPAPAKQPTDEAVKKPLPQPINSDDAEGFLTSAEAATLLGYSEKGFRNAVSSGKIPHYKLFGQNRFKKSELLALLIKVEQR